MVMNKLNSFLNSEDVFLPRVSTFFVIMDQSSSPILSLHLPFHEIIDFDQENDLLITKDKIFKIKKYHVEEHRNFWRRKGFPQEKYFAKKDFWNSFKLERAKHVL